MKLITIMVEQATVEGLSAALPSAGVASVTISEVERYGRKPVAVEVYRGVKIPKYSAKQFRVELLVDDSALDQVSDGISFAVSAGLLGECKGAWVTQAEQLIDLRPATEERLATISA